MEVRQIGSLKVSVVGLGCNNFGWRLDEEDTEAVVRHALEAGITLFDTADVYGGTHSEEYLGRALGGRRGQAIIATKFGSEIDEHRRGRGRNTCGKPWRRACSDWVRTTSTSISSTDPTITCRWRTRWGHWRS